MHPPSSLALNPVDETLRSVAEVGGVGFVGVDVHGEREVRVHAYPHVTEEQFAVAGDADAHGVFVFQTIAQCVGGRHVDVPALADLDGQLTPEALLAQSVENNVRWSMRQILETPEGRERQTEGRVKLAGAIYDMETGRVRFLE